MVALSCAWWAAACLVWVLGRVMSSLQVSPQPLRQPFSLPSLPHVHESTHIGKQSVPHCRTALLFTGQRMGTGLSHDLQRRLTTEPCLPVEGCLVVAGVDPAPCSTPPFTPSQTVPPTLDRDPMVKTDISARQRPHLKVDWTRKVPRAEVRTSKPGTRWPEQGWEPSCRKVCRASHGTVFSLGFAHGSGLSGIFRKYAFQECRWLDPGMEEKALRGRGGWLV